jgi:hypothetical protein
MHKPKFILLALALLLALTLSGCNAAEQGLKPSQDWSRSVSLGNFVVGSAGLNVSPDGERVRVVWPMDTGQETRLHYVQLDRTATLVAERDLEVPPDHLRTPRLLSAGEGRLHLFWASRSAGGRNWQLWYTLIGEDGGAVSDFIQFSDQSTDVGNYSISPDGQDGALVAWDDRSSGGVFVARLAPDGGVPAQQVKISDNGEAPSLRVDKEGRVHLAWFEAFGMRYAQSDLPDLDFSDPLDVAEARIGTGDSLFGPVLGLSDEWVTMAWSILSQSGLEAGTARAFYVSFPIDDPSPRSDNWISILPDENPAYEDFRGFYNFSQIVKSPPQLLRSDFIYQPISIYAQNQQLAMALVVNQAYRADNLDQIAVAVFDQGQYLGYVMAGKTQGLSSDPIIVSDEAGDLYLVWREGSAGQKVYFATTAPAAMARLDRVKSADVVNAVLAGSVEGLASVMLFPVIGFGWMLPGMLVLGVWKLLRDDENLTMWVSRIFLVLAVVFFQAIKLITLPTIAIYVPFSAWMAIPASWADILQVTVPVAILGAGLFLAEWYRRGSDSPSTIRYYITVTAVDAILTLGIYGVSLMGVA